MALKLFSRALLVFVITSCSIERDRFDYESEFKSIVLEFERSSILDFESTEVVGSDFLEKFLNKLDKQKTTFLNEDIEYLRSNEPDQNSFNYFNFKEAIDLYYERYEESLKDRRKILNSYDLNFEKDEFIELKTRDHYFINAEAKLNYQRKIIKNEVINLMLADKNLKEAKSELKRIYSDRLSSISKIRESDKFGLLANNFLSMLDPHATYFSERDLENWNLRMNL